MLTKTKLRIGYLGSCLQLIDNPMRGQVQSLMRYWSRDSGIELESTYYNKFSDLSQDIIDSLDVLVYPMDKYYDRDWFDNWKKFNYRMNFKLIGYSLELTDCYNRASIYEFFNTVTQKMLEHWYSSKLNIATYLVIGTGGTAPTQFDGAFIQYPYYLAPSIWDSNKLDLMYELIRKGIRIGDEIKCSVSDRRGISMVYQRPNRYRERFADILDVVTGGKVVYSGKWRNNDKSIPFTYDYDIVDEYYSTFKFNIAIENDYQPGWVTEKVINPLLGGCVPIYFDPFHQFPSWILNQNACMLIDYDNMSDLLLLQDIDKQYDKYVGEPIFVEDAEKNLDNWINNVIEILNSVLK